MKKSLIFLLLSIVSQMVVQGQQSKRNYKNHMFQLQKAIENNFFVPGTGFYKETVHVENGKNAYSFLWPLCGLIQANNEIERVTGKKNLVAKTLRTIKAYYDVRPPSPGYASYIIQFNGGDRFYDDNQWIGIACMDAFLRDPKKNYLEVSKEIYKYMMTGYDTVLAGGLYWQENNKTGKNTCSNGPGIILAMQLYKATGERKFLDTALLIYNWVNKNLKAHNGLYYDNIQVGTKQIGKAIYSYNTGTMLQSNLYLYEATRDEKYLTEAITIADSAQVFFYNDGKFRDSYWFNAVLLRAYQHLLKFKPDKKYISAFKLCLDNSLKTDLNEFHLMGKSKPLDLVSQSGMLEILARFAYLEKNIRFNTSP